VLALFYFLKAVQTLNVDNFLAINILKEKICSCFGVTVNLIPRVSHRPASHPLQRAGERPWERGCSTVYSVGQRLLIQVNFRLLTLAPEI